MKTKLAALGLAVLLASGASGKTWKLGTWGIVELKDPITDAPRVIAETASSDTRGAWLQIRCEASQPLLLLVIEGDKFRSGEDLGGAIRIDGTPQQIRGSGLGATRKSFPPG
jgi:hypothetical protein